MKTKANDCDYLNPSLGLADVPATNSRLEGMRWFTARKVSQPGLENVPCRNGHSRAGESIYV